MYVNYMDVNYMDVNLAEHPREDNPDLYYWDEITVQHTQTFDI